MIVAHGDAHQARADASPERLPRPVCKFTVHTGGSWPTVLYRLSIRVFTNSRGLARGASGKTGSSRTHISKVSSSCGTRFSWGFCHEFVMNVLNLCSFKDSLIKVNNSLFIQNEILTSGHPVHAKALITLSWAAHPDWIQTLARVPILRFVFLYFYIFNCVILFCPVVLFCNVYRLESLNKGLKKKLQNLKQARWTSWWQIPEKTNQSVCSLFTFGGKRYLNLK